MTVSRYWCGFSAVSPTTGIQLASLVRFYSDTTTGVVVLNSPPEVGWTIPFTAVATSFAAVLTQFFLSHRYVDFSSFFFFGSNLNISLVSTSSPVTSQLLRFCVYWACWVSPSEYMLVLNRVSSISMIFFGSSCIDGLIFRLRVKNFAPLTPFVICWLGFSTAADLSITGMA